MATEGAALSGRVVLTAPDDCVQRYGSENECVLTFQVSATAEGAGKAASLAKRVAR